MATKQRSYRVCDFRRWLIKNQCTYFDKTECGCPIAKWLDIDATYSKVDKLPPWVNRFVAWWDATDIGYGKAEAALTVLNCVAI